MRHPALGLGVFAAMTFFSSAPRAQTLKDAAATRGLFIGSAVDDRALSGDVDYARVLAEQFNMLTPENAMKFDAVHPRPGATASSYDFSRADRVMEFAAAHRMSVRGHTLVWHRIFPQWAAALPPERLKELLKNHLQTVAGHFAGRVYSWDVVNEAVDDDGRLRTGAWANAETQYIADSFRWAHEADPKAKLFYNDYINTYGRRGLMAEKTEAILRLLRDLKAQGVPIDGVGLQMHLASARDYGDMRGFIHLFAGLGLEVHITELDVSLVNVDAALAREFGFKPFPRDLRDQAALYAQGVSACVSEPACKAVVFWGFTDKHDWLPIFLPAMLDERYAPKPAFEAVRKALLDERKVGSLAADLAEGLASH